MLEFRSLQSIMDHKSDR